MTSKLSHPTSVFDPPLAVGDIVLSISGACEGELGVVSDVLSAGTGIGGEPMVEVDFGLAAEGNLIEKYQYNVQRIINLTPAQAEVLRRILTI